jgi:hypothetical protein
VVTTVKATLHKLWLRVQEPRGQSGIYFFAYLAIFVLGLAVAVDPPRAVQGTTGHPLVVGWAGMLVAGGGLGAATTLQGAWFLERAAAILCGSAMLVYGIAVTAIPVSQTSLRVASVCSVIFSILAFAARLAKTSRHAYDPEK